MEAIKRASFGAALVLALTQPSPPAFAQTEGSQEPMSAIDWLSRSVVTPVGAPVPPGFGGEPPVSAGAGVESVSVTPLDRPSANGLGLLPVSRTGLPRDLWGETPEPQLATALRKERVETLPAIQSFLMTLLLAELDPPRVPDPQRRDTLFLARIDRLLDLGALEPALALLQQAEPSDPEVFRRQFDVALLLGEEDRACAIMRDTPGIAPSFPARIFCLARQGDWNAAALSLATGRTLGQIDAEMAALLERFLDPELAEESDLPPPAHPTPLVFRMMEAIGQPMPTTSLPVAFSQADLRSNTGWKARIEAGERLARLGAVDPNQLLGLYTERQAAASGGVWDRVAAMRALDAAMAESDVDAVTKALPEAFDVIEPQELEPVLAALYGAPLAQMKLQGRAGDLAFRLGVLSAEYETVARTRSPKNADERLLIGVAQGDTSGVLAQDQLGVMLKQVFDAPPSSAPPEFAALLPTRLGEAMLLAIDEVTEGARGEYRRVSAGLQLLRFVGLESVARRAALELLVLERRG